MIFERFASAFERKLTDVSDLTWTNLFPETRSHSGVSVSYDAALRTTTVFACTRVISEGIAQLPKNLYDYDLANNSKTKNTTHQAYRLLTDTPNEWMTSFEFFETMTMHAVLTGNAFAYIGRSGKKIIELIPLVPNQVSMVRNVDWSIDYYVTDLAGKMMKLDSANVFHLKGPSWNNYQGMDVVQLAREAIGLSIATETTHASLHANGAQPGGILSVKGKLDKDGRDRLKAAWHAFYGGVANRYKTAVLDQEATWQQLGMNGVDAQHLETRRFQIEEVCRAMRVFPQMVMHTDKTATFASAEVFFLAHVVHSLGPWVTRWEEAISKYILADDANLKLKLDTASIQRGDAQSRAAFYQAALGGARGETAYMTRNEVRDIEGLNPIAGGDKLLIPVIAPPGAPPGSTDNSAVAKALEVIADLAAKMNPNHGNDGRFISGPGGGSGGFSQVRAALAAVGGAAAIASRAVLKHLIASGASRLLVRYAVVQFGLPAVAAVAAEMAISAIYAHVTKATTEDADAALDQLTPDELNRLANALVDRLSPDDLQALMASVTGSKMNPNHDDHGRFATASQPRQAYTRPALKKPRRSSVNGLAVRRSRRLMTLTRMPTPTSNCWIASRMA
jgi:HK97 family phage portal protein